MSENKRDLTADLAICESATAGPWDVDEWPKVDQIGIEYGISEYVCKLSDGNKNKRNDAAFIAEARTGWPHAIKRALAAEHQLAELCPIADLDVITSLRVEKAHMAEHTAELEAEVERLNGLIREYVRAEYKYFFVRDDRETYLKYRAAENALIDHAEDLREREGLHACDECGEEYAKESSVYQDCCKSCADKQDMIDNGWEDDEGEWRGCQEAK